MKNYITAFLFLAIFALLSSCKHPKTEDNTNNNPPPIDSSSNVMGYNMLAKLPGIWTGSIESTTSLGNFPSWTVDFRPISASQVSGKSELDTVNDIFLSIFIVQHNGSYKLAFRNGGGFAGMQRISYEVCDSVVETSGSSYYRFVDFVKGDKRTINEFVFRGDSMYMITYTNKNNTQATCTLHERYSAKRVDATSAANAIAHFSFPQKTVTKDFTHTFDGFVESVWYSYAGDPYPESSQPYLGKATINISNGTGTSFDPNKHVLIIITTQPLYSGITYNAGNLKYLSRYVVLNAGTNAYTFTYMHPGSYYLYALYDKDGNNTFSTGDYVSYPGSQFTVAETQTTTASVTVNVAVP